MAKYRTTSQVFPYWGVALATVYLLGLNPAAVAAGEAPADAKAAVSCSVEMAPMRDGVKLATEVYRPAAPGKYPVIMQRSPYNGWRYSVNSSSPSQLEVFSESCKHPGLLAMAAKGYAVLNQDVRGTHRSEGKFMPILNEGNDGYDAVEWAARQPWSTGKVGMLGGSYLGIVQWQAALKRPPHLVTIAPSVAPISFDTGFPYERPGILNKLVAQFWTAKVRQDLMYRELTAAKVPAEEISSRIAEYQVRSRAALLAPPAQDMPVAQNSIFRTELTPWYEAWLSHPTLDSYWAPSNVKDKFDKLNIPVLSLGAFYDLFISGTVAGFRGMQSQGATPRARANSYMILAGGGHVKGTNGYLGNTTFGSENAIPQEFVIRWFDYWLKGIENGVTKEPPVKLYVMVPPDQGSVGSGFWVSGDSYPLQGTETKQYFLSGGKANTIAGTGSLSPSLVADDSVDQYQFDPANPVPTVGGAICCEPELVPGGVFDQRSVEMRSDVLVYTSEELTSAVPVIGNVTVTLRASSSSQDTLFTARLVDVYPDGYAQNVTDGVVLGNQAPSNSVATYTIEMSPTATVFKRGHRIRLEISSSSHPRFAVNTNLQAKPGDLAPVTQTILRKGTSLNLPVAPANILPDFLQ